MKLRNLSYISAPTKSLAKKLLIELHKKNIISDNTLKEAIHSYSAQRDVFCVSYQQFISYSYETRTHTMSMTYYGEEFKETNFITNFNSIYSKEFGLIEFLSYNEFINYIKAMHEWINILYVPSFGFRVEEIEDLKLNIKIEYMPIHGNLDKTFRELISDEINL